MQQGLLHVSLKLQNSSLFKCVMVNKWTRRLMSLFYKSFCHFFQCFSQLFVDICLERLLLFVGKTERNSIDNRWSEVKLIEFRARTKNAAQRWPHAGDYETRLILSLNELSEIKAITHTHILLTSRWLNGEDYRIFNQFAQVKRR